MKLFFEWGGHEALYFFVSFLKLEHTVTFFFSVLAVKDPTAVERANLLNMAKLSIKGLIESALSFGRTLDSDYPPLQQFFVVMEHCLKHGLKGVGICLAACFSSQMCHFSSFPSGSG